jgi:hypothetical protein
LKYGATRRMVVMNMAKVKERTIYKKERICAPLKTKVTRCTIEPKGKIVQTKKEEKWKLTCTKNNITV